MATVPSVQSKAWTPNLGSPAPTRHRLSVEDYYRMAEVGILTAAMRVELINGEVIDMSPIGALHAALVNVLSRYFTQWCGDSAIVSCQNPLRLDDENEPEPDVVVLRPREDCYSTAHPTPGDALLLVEVSDTSLDYDLTVKVPLYAQSGVPEVWVVEAATRKTHLFQLPQTNASGRAGYAMQRLISPNEPLPLAVPLAELSGPVDSGREMSISTLLPNGAE
jgi:Uma2 family endonuclease